MGNRVVALGFALVLAGAAGCSQSEPVATPAAPAYVPTEVMEVPFDESLRAVEVPAGESPYHLWLAYSARRASAKAIREDVARLERRYAETAGAERETIRGRWWTRRTNYEDAAATANLALSDYEAAARKVRGR